MVATSYAEVVAVLGLRCSCRVWGAHAEIAVLRPRLRWLEHLNLSMSTSILAWAPQSWHEHRNLGMSTTILAWAPQSWHEHLNPSIGGRHRMLYFNIQRTEKYSIAMCYMHSHFKEGIPEKKHHFFWALPKLPLSPTCTQIRQLFRFFRDEKITFFLCSWKLSENDDFDSRKWL